MFAWPQHQTEHVCCTVAAPSLTNYLHSDIVLGSRIATWVIAECFLLSEVMVEYAWGRESYLVSLQSLVWTFRVCWYVLSFLGRVLFKVVEDAERWIYYLKFQIDENINSLKTDARRNDMKKLISTSQITNPVSLLGSRLMIFTEIIDGCCGNHLKYKNTLCG